MNRIRDLREDRDLRQSDVANATGIDRKTISNYETGKTNPDSFAIIKLAEFFGVSTDYLLGVEKANSDLVSDAEKKPEDIKKRVVELEQILEKIRRG